MKIRSDIYICATYIPPKDSTFWNSYQDTDPYELLEQDIEKFNKTGEVVVIGDFNARTGNKIDFVSYFNDDDAETFVRNSGVTVLGKLKINNYGNSLIDICKGLNLRILNGRTLGDSTGKFTCFHYNGQSTIDYIIASENLMQAITTMQVSSPTHLSDHAHVSCLLNTGHKMIKNNDTRQFETLNIRQSLNLNGITKDSSDNFKKSLKLPIIRDEFHKLQTEKFELLKKAQT